ncbi:transporter substrate-binding domain-containing protein (plasmid) [Arthrobacter sp. UC242_113]|uniref:ABC transporter substrate-binding protein n=1 Tax=Arthrobacter sp. UC242_113 TaxID=3374550 RepID=UPI0037567D00
MTKPTKYSLAAIGLVILALLSGYFGAGMRGQSASASGSAQGAWIDTIKKNGELRVGVATSPPMTVEKDGKLGGPNLIPLQRLADELGVKLTTVPASWGNIVSGLQANRYDVAANLNSTLQRAVAIQFSEPVYQYPAVFLVAANSPFKTAEDVLAKKQPVASPAGTAEGAAAKKAGAEVLEVPDWTNAFQSLQAGRVSAVFADLGTAQSQAQKDKAFKIIVPEHSIYQGAAAYGLPANIDPRSLDLVNLAIFNAQLSGDLDRAYEEVGYLTVDKLGSLRK